MITTGVLENHRQQFQGAAPIIQQYSIGAQRQKLRRRSGMSPTPGSQITEQADNMAIGHGLHESVVEGGERSPPCYSPLRCTRTPVRSKFLCLPFYKKNATITSNIIY
ncbi:MAG: hypothetical protein EBE86_023805 [Hormoscilla sp. GUM202]|nr:hypothetical protein [Hormoscilla sp. GUM202]